MWLSAKVTLKVKKIKIKTADNCGAPVLSPIHTIKITINLTILASASADNIVCLF